MRHIRAYCYVTGFRGQVNPFTPYQAGFGAHYMWLGFFYMFTQFGCIQNALARHRYEHWEGVIVWWYTTMWEPHGF